MLLGCGGANDSSQNADSPTSEIRKKDAVKLDPGKYPGMVYIPPGEFTMGTNPKQEKAYPASLGFTNAPYHNESPARKVYLDGFYIDKYEVTIGEYAKFVESTGREFPEPIQGLNIDKYKNYPMSCVTWYDASDYAKWANKLLPTEAEWEKAARGTDGRRYPWGNKIDPKKANFSKKGIFPVGTYKEDVSFYGVQGMGGSLDEWVRVLVRNIKFIEAGPGEVSKDIFCCLNIPQEQRTEAMKLPMLCQTLVAFDVCVRNNMQVASK